MSNPVPGQASCASIIGVIINVRRLGIMLVATISIAAVHPRLFAWQSPQALADELLAADRSYSAAAAGRNVVDALTAMFRDDVTMSAPGKFTTSRAEARELLSTNAANLTARVDWRPLRVGISADGAHGFTLGVMTIREKDGAVKFAKYMGYWIKDPAGWRVAVYKRAPSVDPGASPEMIAPSLPAARVPVSTDSSLIDAYRDSLRQTEQAFSDEAQKIGIGPAFAKYGRPDASNMGGPDKPGFVFSAQAIASGFGPDADKGSPVSWNADRAIVASSGDLGVTIGFIRSNDPAASRPPFAFFTIWRRDTPSAPWRYVAE